MLRVNKTFELTPECDEAFQNVKQHLRMLLPLYKPAKVNALSLYLSISLVSLSSVLVKDMAKGKCLYTIYQKYLHSMK